MYQPSIPCGAQVPCTAGFSWISTLVPGDASGVLLKSNAPLSCALADSLGWS